MVGGHPLVLSAGMSWGDAPTEAAQAIWDVYRLPEEVLTALGVLRDIAVAPKD